MRKKKVAIGLEFYDRIIEENVYYVDKTLLIKELLDNSTQVSLITRPRRFGKTLALTMLKCFFEKTEKNTAKLVDGTKIAAEGEKYMQHQGKYPVIFISLKDVNGRNFESALYMLKSAVRYEYKDIDQDKLDEQTKQRYIEFQANKDDYKVFKDSLDLLIKCTYQSTGIKPIVLIDEYDVPLQAAGYGGYYDEMLDFIRGFISSALKTNDSLGKAVLTGCLRVSKESLFTGFNNLKVYSVDDTMLSEYFGFTQDEVDEMAAYFGFSEKLEDMKKWYNGYKFGETEIYNPWSILNCFYAFISGDKFPYRPYWVNTSSNSIIRELIEKSGADIRSDLEILLSGGSIKKYINDTLTYRDIDVRNDSIWSFLYHTGYLKSVEMRYDENGYLHELVIPNEEVFFIYRTELRAWLNESLRAEPKSELAQAIKNIDTKKTEEIINKWLVKTISYHDSKESFYHGFMVGLLASASENFRVTSNREYGDGRPDIFISYEPTHELAVIIELKYAKFKKELDSRCDEALEQIKEKNYAAELVDEYDSIVKLGIAFCGKICRVKCSN